MPRGKSKQLRMLDESLDPYIVKTADRVIELQTEYKKMKELLEVESKNLMGQMVKLGKKKIRHGGATFEVAETEAKKKLKVKIEKEQPKKNTEPSLN